LDAIGRAILGDLRGAADRADRLTRRTSRSIDPTDDLEPADPDHDSDCPPAVKPRLIRAL